MLDLKNSNLDENFWLKGYLHKYFRDSRDNPLFILTIISSHNLYANDEWGAHDTVEWRVKG